MVMVMNLIQTGKAFSLMKATLQGIQHEVWLTKATHNILAFSQRREPSEYTFF